MMSCPKLARTLGRALLKALPQEAETSRSSQSGSRGRPAPRRRGSGWPANPLPASGILVLGSAFCSLPSDLVLACSAPSWFASDTSSSLFLQSVGSSPRRLKPPWG